MTLETGKQERLTFLPFLFFFFFFAIGFIFSVWIPQSVIFSYCCCCHSLVSTLCNPMDCSMPGFPVLHYLPEFTQTHVHWVDDTIQPFHLPSSPSSPALNLTQHQFSLVNWLFSSGGQNIRALTSASVRPSNEYSGLILFGMDWFNLLAVQETLKSLLQHHSSKASVLLYSAFFMVQLSHQYMTTGKKTNKRSFDYTDLCWQSGK